MVSVTIFCSLGVGARRAMREREGDGMLVLAHLTVVIGVHIHLWALLRIQRASY